MCPAQSPVFQSKNTFGCLFISTASTLITWTDKQDLVEILGLHKARQDFELSFLISGQDACLNKLLHNRPGLCEPLFSLKPRQISDARSNSVNMKSAVCALSTSLESSRSQWRFRGQRSRVRNPSLELTHCYRSDTWMSAKLGKNGLRWVNKRMLPVPSFKHMGLIPYARNLLQNCMNGTAAIRWWHRGHRGEMWRLFFT